MDRHFFSESEMALFIECRLKCAQKLFDTVDIVREAMLRQQPLNSDSASVEWMEVAHEDDDVPIIGWAL